MLEDYIWWCGWRCRRGGGAGWPSGPDGRRRRVEGRGTQAGRRCWVAVRSGWETKTSRASGDSGWAAVDPARSGCGSMGAEELGREGEGEIVGEWGWVRGEVWKRSGLNEKGRDQVEKRKMAAGNFELKSLFIYPRDLWITWGADERYWKWHWLLLQSQDYKDIEVPQLLEVCWLEIKGKVNMSQLTPKAKYEVVLVVMKMEGSFGWEYPVTLSLDMPNGKSTSRKSRELKDMPPKEWKELVVGSFTASGSGDVTFSMLGDDKAHWKNGLVVKYVEVRPAV